MTQTKYLGEFVLAEMKDLVTLHGPMINDSTSQCITEEEEDFDLRISEQNKASVLAKLQETISTYYQQHGFEAVIRPSAVQVKKNNRIVKYVVITENPCGGLLFISVKRVS